MNFKKLVASGALTVALCGFGSAANALPIGLALVLDESGSIDNTEFNLQKQGYIDVLGSSLISTDGSLVIGVWKFASGTTQVFAPTLIDSAAAKASLVAAVTSMTNAGGGTRIDLGVDAALAGFLAFGGGGASINAAVFDKVVIDVSTDGVSSGDPLGSSNAALAAGVAQVNCLAIGNGANCNWNPASSLDFAATSFNDFGTILAQKVAAETGQGIPEPASLALLGIGLAGLGASRRRKAS